MENISYPLKKKSNDLSVKVTSFWFFIFLLSCSTLLAFNIGVGSIKLSQIMFFVFIISSLSFVRFIKKTIRIIDRYTNFVLFSIIIVSAASLYYSVNRLLTINLLIQLFINLLIFYWINIGLIFKTRLYNNLKKIILFVFWLFVFLTILHYLMSFVLPILRTPSNSDGALFEGIKPSVFFGDSNWHCNYMFFIYYSIYLQYKNKDIKRRSLYAAIAGMLVVIVLTLSRIMLLVFFIHLLFYFQHRSKKLLLSILFAGVFVYYSPLPSMILPERYTYDLYDTERNPRYIDSIFLIEEVEKYGKDFFGFGVGTLAYANDDIIWSGKSEDSQLGTTINVLPAQIYFDLGLVGLLFFTILFLISLFRKGNEESKFIIVTAVLCCTFHMPGYMNFFWLFMGYFYFLINIRPIQKARII